jgi:hypothetical protein
VAVALGAAACGSAAGEDPESMAALVQDWYAEADPAICSRLTDNLLESGWEEAGDAGRAACRDSVSESDPVDEVAVGPPVVEGDMASVDVVYTLAGERRADRIHFLLVDGDWLADSVARLRSVDDATTGATI